MDYLCVALLTHGKGRPSLVYLELDADRWETRKVEVYEAGKMRYSDEKHDDPLIGLSELPIQPFAQIAADPEFLPREIDSEEFEAVWRQALHQASKR